MNGIYGNGIQMTEKVLDLLWGRQNVTLNNIANVDTPGSSLSISPLRRNWRGK